MGGAFIRGVRLLGRIRYASWYYLSIQLQSDLVNPTQLVLSLFLVGLETAGSASDPCILRLHVYNPLSKIWEAVNCKSRYAQTLGLDLWWLGNLITEGIHTSVVGREMLTSTMAFNMFNRWKSRIHVSYSSLVSSCWLGVTFGQFWLTFRRHCLTFGRINHTRNLYIAPIWPQSNSHGRIIQTF